jgi:hypothetical protein
MSLTSGVPIPFLDVVAGPLLDETINRGPVSQQVWHVKKLSLIKAISAKLRFKFAAQSPVMVTAAQ